MSWEGVVSNLHRFRDESYVDERLSLQRRDQRACAEARLEN